MPLLGTRGVASARGFGFGGQINPFWLGSGGAGTFESYNDSVVDPEGNIYLAGANTYDFTYGLSQLFLQKYTASGILIWGKRFRVPSVGNRINAPRIALDSPTAPSFIYMVGTTGGDNSSTLIKISCSNGTVSWQRRLSGQTSFYTAGIAVSGSNVYCTGGQSSTMWVMRHNTDGTLLNHQSYTFNNRNQTVEPFGCAPAANGDLYLSGYVTVSNNPNIFWMRLTSALTTPTWQFSASMDAREAFAATRSDASENMYWACSHASGGNRQWRVGKRNSSGAQIWTSTLNPSAQGELAVSAQFRSLAVSSTQEVYLCGVTNNGRSGDGAPIVAKFTIDGNLQFIKRFPVQQVSTGATLNAGNPVATSSSTGYVMANTGPSLNNPSYKGVFNLPANGSKNGQYIYGDRRFIYEDASVSGGLFSLGSTNPGITTFSFSMSSGNTGMDTANEQQNLNPIPI